MAMYDKPGAASGPRDRHTHYNDPYDRASREIRTVQKKIWGLDGLSKKERAALENSTNDGMASKIAYSLNKSKRWELCSSPESFIEKMASLDQVYPVAAVDQCILKNEYTALSYSQKDPNDDDVKSIKVKSGNGGPFLSLRDSMIEKPSTPKALAERRRIKGETAKEFVEAPSILYCIANHHSDELFFRKLIGKSHIGARTTKKNKIVDLKDIEENSSDTDSDFGDCDNIDDSGETSMRTSTLADFIISKPSKLNNKRRKNNHDFEIINEISKEKAPAKFPTLTNTNDLIESSFTEIRFINIEKTETLELPNFESFEFMFDFEWLNEEKTKCLFMIPKGSENNVLTNFNSILILELSENQRNRLIRMTIKSVHEIHIPSSSGNPLKATSEIEMAIRKLWEQGIAFLNKQKNEPKKIFYQPQTSIFSTFNPMGDYARLGFNKSSSSISRSSSMNEYEKVESEACNLCSHGREGNLTTLKCGHTFCRFCSEKFIKEQIICGKSQLSCTKCSTLLEPSFILISTPLLLLQAYLRFQFLKQENTIECPNKCGVAFIEDSPKFNGIQCSECKSVFCIKCKSEPHFPLTCDQMNQWENRFMPQYIAETHKPSTASENLETVEEECPSHLRWMVNRSLHYHYLFPYLSKMKSAADDEIKPINVTTSIASVCIEARYKRMKTKYLKTLLIKQFGKVSTEQTKEVRYDLYTALYLLEFGFAWIYFSRKYKSLEYKSIKQALYNLKAVFVEIESRIFSGNHQEAMEKINLLRNLCKIIIEKF
uniref:RING-type domain-containing protein n=1 Tax=Panagrolaimus sp. PS1159 TaxID=55785 RepID=A0AC35FMU1_9BILA